MTTSQPASSVDLLRFRLWPGTPTEEYHATPSSRLPVPPASLVGLSPVWTRTANPARLPLTVGDLDSDGRFYLTASGREAIWLSLAGLPGDREIWITSSVGTTLRRISPCVLRAVGRRARISGEPSERTVGVVLVHEWGFPHPARATILDQAKHRGWRVVDDCAHALRYGLDLARGGSTVAFSLPKLFPVTGTGLLANPTWLSGEAGELISVSPRGPLFREVQRRSARHVANWMRLGAIADAHGFASIDRLTEGIVPQVFRLAIAAQFSARSAFGRVGIETTPPFYTGWIALPCHSTLEASYWRAVERGFDQIGNRGEPDYATGTSALSSFASSSVSSDALTPMASETTA